MSALRAEHRQRGTRARRVRGLVALGLAAAVAAPVAALAVSPAVRQIYAPLWFRDRKSVV